MAPPCIASEYDKQNEKGWGHTNGRLLESVLGPANAPQHDLRTHDALSQHR